MSAGKSVLFITSEFPPGPGGIGTQAYQLSDRLHKLGWNMNIVASQDYVTVEDVEKFNSRLPFNITYRRSEGSLPVKLWSYMRKILKVYRDSKADVIITSGDTPTFFVLLLRLFMHKPWVIIEHGNIQLGMVQKLKKIALRKANEIIYVSDRTRKHIEEFSGISPEKYIIIPNGGDERVYSKIPAEEIQQYRQQFAAFSPLLLTVGNVSVRKGQEIVIRALPEIKKQFPNVLYIMAGKPTIQDEMQALADQLGVGGNIHFTGIVSEAELVNLYNSVDLFLMTSRRDTRTNEIEGFGIAVIEAALCGRAAVVSGNSGLAEAVEEGVTGFVTEENNPASVADAVIKLFTDNILRQQMENAAYTRANQSLTWEKVALQYDAVLKKLTGNTNGIRRN